MTHPLSLGVEWGEGGQENILRVFICTVWKKEPNDAVSPYAILAEVCPKRILHFCRGPRDERIINSRALLRF